MTSSARSHPRTEALPRWFWALAAVALVLSMLPYLFSWAIQPEGTLYLGVNSNYDDHSVYAAWTKQSQEGRFFFDDRFTTDAQPRLTVNLYFLAAGWLAKIVGIPLALHLFKALFGLLFLIALYRLVERVSECQFARAVMMVTTVFGGGIGWAVWHRYGNLGPIDTWQPEAFTFPSLMTVGLFCAALWLICAIWNKILDAENSWRPVLPGALAALALTNFHTYDTLGIAIVASGFLCIMVLGGRAKREWILRAGCIATGALPSLLWYRHVHNVDWVFQQRALTGTFTPAMEQVLVGYGPLLALALVGAWFLARESAVGKWMPLVALALLCACIPLQHASGYAAKYLWIDIPTWIPLAFVGALVCGLYGVRKPAHALLFAWMLMGIIALYYPGFFQRKLAMGLSVPIGMLAGYTIATWYRNAGSLARPLTIASVLLVSLTSLRWMQREMQMARENISVTTLHHIYWDKDIAAVLEYLKNNHTENDVLISRPGQAIPEEHEGQETTFMVAIPELNGVMTGWAGIRTYYGHWSETPLSPMRHDEVIKAMYYLPTTTEDSARSLITKAGATYVLAFKGQVAALLRMPPVSFYQKFAQPVYEGENIVLLRVTPT